MNRGETKIINKAMAALNINSSSESRPHMLSNDVLIIMGLKIKQTIVEAQITKAHIITFFTENLICAAYPLSKKSDDKPITVGSIPGNANIIVVNNKYVCIYTET
ncbi:hypothetical protein RYZ57_20520 [Enterobacter hormaechei]|uniref:hypothetical protein n=1 Tax=Enterobacter hormaechei TaxID=158836 RepID=UPI002963D5CE|nr:hypothetical protein [Enterobacter hormaechei]MDW2601527.1 hypothetical protein [Enterobacter hormaechei]